MTVHPIVAALAGLRPIQSQNQLVHQTVQLPPILRFGGSERGPLQSQQFTGAAVQHPLSLLTGNAPTPFVAPTYAPSAPLAPVHPTAPSLAQALTGISPVAAAPSGLGAGPPKPAPPPVKQRGPGFGAVPQPGQPRSDVVNSNSGSPEAQALTSLADALAQAGRYGLPKTTTQFQKYQ
jgi:hypothetical protein